jgi:transposase-like protein
VRITGQRIAGQPDAGYLSAAHFHNEQAAVDFIEARLWAASRACPHCGARERHRRLAGKSTRPGVWKCYHCRKPFTVRLGTLFQGSHVPLHLWLQAIFLLTAGRRRLSIQALQRTLGVTLKTAWCMSHRIRSSIASDADQTHLPGTGGSP